MDPTYRDRETICQVAIQDRPGNKKAIFSKASKMYKKCTKVFKGNKTIFIVVLITLSAVGAACLLGLYLARGTNLIFSAMGYN